MNWFLIKEENFLLENYVLKLAMNSIKFQLTMNLISTEYLSLLIFATAI